MTQPGLEAPQPIVWDYHDTEPIWTPRSEIFTEAARRGLTQAKVALSAQRFRMKHRESHESHTAVEWQLLFVSYLEEQWLRGAER